MASCWWSHKWGKWTDIENGAIHSVKSFAGYEIERQVSGSFITQERRCERCGDVQRRTLDFRKEMKGGAR